MSFNDAAIDSFAEAEVVGVDQESLHSLIMQ
jgi:hypothetical protein